MTSSCDHQPTIVSLLLHDVTDHPDSSGFLQPTAFRYKHSTEQFRQYLDVVAESSLPVITPACGNSDASVAVMLTFDDGGVAAPATADLLEQYGWRGVFFITTDLIGSKGFVSAEQIRELNGRGHVIGSHSCSHPDVFRSLNRVQMQEEWCRSRDELQQILGQSITCCSIPGGDSSDATIEEAAAAGYRHVFTSEQLTRPWNQAGACCYGRLMMVDSTAPETLERWLRHPSYGILPERLLRFTKSSVKQLMGPMYLRMVQRRRALHDCSR